MGYAEVTVNSPIAQNRSFSYSIPPGLNVKVGQAVWVPFGPKILQGIVVELTAHPAVEETREIVGVIESQPLLSPEKVNLARWLSEYYLSPLFDAISLMLPPGFERRVLTFLSRKPKSALSGMREDSTQVENPDVGAEQLKVLQLIGQKKTDLKEIEKSLGKRKAQNIVNQLVHRGFLERSYEMEKAKVKPKIVPHLRLLIPTPVALEEAIRLKIKKAIKQGELIEFMAKTTQPVPISEARKTMGFSGATVKALVEKGLIELQQVEVKREPISYLQMALSLPLTLTSAQKSAFEAIKSSLNGFVSSNINVSSSPNLSPHGRESTVFLLRGVTGSGKTEVYLQALAEAVRLGKRGIVLVPEISLTPQTIERFASRFPHRVAVLHSQLSLGEQYDEWQRIRNGEFDVVIGPRSALFAPQPDLGLIVIDEEHEWTYKQTDKSPRYNARDTAIKLAELTGAVVVLGSATPDVGTYYHTVRGDYRLLSLPERVTPREGSPLPEVEIVDLKRELMTGNRSIFSRSLSARINSALENHEQVLLFLNRRGGATFVQCRRCGFVIHCKRCDVSMTYHLDENLLVCHQCNYRIRVPVICPRCTSRRIKFVGIGTQKVEQEAGKEFPFARLLRWDSDVTGQKDAHKNILNYFRDHKADILIGTQMIAKGLDLPLVTLVGVINADTALNLPDFRAGEKTFQLLSQVAGRAGRGTLGGKVIIQTYSPENYAIQAASKHDYAQFYEQEVAYRRKLNDPPFSHLVRLVYTYSNDTRCREEAEKLAHILASERDAAGIADLSIIGPAPAFIHRLRGRYRWQIILRGSSPSSLLTHITLPRGWTVDVDPVGIV